MKKVLIVEDDQAIRESLGDLIEMEGYEVELAVDGAEGLSKMKSYHPDVVILDIMMPVMDGKEVLLRKSQDSAIASIPVLVVSASQRADIQHLPGIRKIIGKPADMDRILESVKNAVG